MSDPYDIIRRWERAFNAGNSALLAALYAPDAILWGTLTQALIVSPQAIHAYFMDAAAAGLKVSLGEHASTKLSGDCVIDAGHYELSHTKDDNTALFPARYSIALALSDSGWRIFHHHSSMLPSTPA